MADPQSPACVCNSSYSALSTTANVISIITFAYVLLLGILYQIALSQRSKDSTNSLREDVTTLRQKCTDLKTAAQAVDAYPTPQFVPEFLDKINLELSSVERDLSCTFPPSASSEKWYVIWGQLKDVGRRAKLRRRVSAVQTRLDMYTQF